MTNAPTKAANAVTRSGAYLLARNEYTTAIGAANQNSMDMGKLDGRELSPASICVQARAVAKSNRTATQPRDGNLRTKQAMETPTSTAAKLKIGNAVNESIRSNAPYDPS